MRRLWACLLGMAVCLVVGPAAEPLLVVLAFASIAWSLIVHAQLVQARDRHLDAELRCRQQLDRVEREGRRG